MVLPCNTYLSLFDISISNVYGYIIPLTNFLYFKLGDVPIWPTREQMNEYMPESFRRPYPSSYIVRDHHHCHRKAHYIRTIRVM